MHARCLGGQQEEKRPYKTMVVTSREQAAFLSGWPNLCHALTADSGECPIGSDTLPQPIALPRGASCFPRAGHSRPLALVCPDHPLTQTIQNYRRRLVCTPGAPNSPPPIAKCSDSILDNETNCAPAMHSRLLNVLAYGRHLWSRFSFHSPSLYQPS